jgi:hypothetical protein
MSRWITDVDLVKEVIPFGSNEALRLIDGLEHEHC